MLLFTKHPGILLLHNISLACTLGMISRLCPVSENVDRNTAFINYEVKKKIMNENFGVGMIDSPHQGGKLKKMGFNIPLVMY